MTETVKAEAVTRRRAGKWHSAVSFGALWCGFVSVTRGATLRQSLYTKEALTVKAMAALGH